MRLSITLTALSVLLRFYVPGQGAFYLFNMNGRGWAEIVIVSNCTNQTGCAIEIVLPRTPEATFYWTEFLEGSYVDFNSGKVH